MKGYRTLMFVVVVIFSCKKSDNHPVTNPPAFTYTIDSASSQPGMFLTLTANAPITKDTGTAMLGGKSVFLFKIDSLHYAFTVPVIAPGNYPLDLKNLNSTNTPILNLRNYSAITNPDSVFMVITNQFNKLADSLEKNSLFNPNAANDATFIRQLSLQFEQNITQCSGDQKLLIAYESQIMVPDISLFQKSKIDTTYIPNRNAGVEDICDDVIAKLVTFVKTTTKAYGSAGISTIALIAVFKAPPAIRLEAIITAIIALKAYFIYTKNALKAEGEAFVPIFQAVQLFDETGSSTNPIQVNNNSLISKKFWANFRTIRKSDASSSIPDVANAIKAASGLAALDLYIKQLYVKMKSEFASFFNIIQVDYTPFVSTVLETAKEKVIEVPSTSLAVTNVSNSDISVTATDDGNNGLKISVKNPSNNIKVPTEFSFQVTYEQKAINNTVTVKEQAKFSPSAPPTVTTTVAGSVTSSSAEIGGIIISDGGSEILDRGITYSINPNLVPSNTISTGTGTNTFLTTITGLLSNKTYYVRAYATNKVGTNYGDIVHFTTLINPKVALSGTYSGTATWTNYDGTGQDPKVGLSFTIKVDENGILTGYMTIDGHTGVAEGTASESSISIGWTPQDAPFKYTGTFSAEKNIIEGSGGAGNYYAPLSPNGPFKVVKQ